MSSLSAARADNFYYPPDWDPSKESLREHTKDTKGRNQYEQLGVIRFEMPMDAWCEGCSRHVAKGVRFNAKKDADGKYHSTTVWRFTMQCPSCTQQFVIKTDPRKSDYAFASGARRKIEEYDADEADGARALVDTDHRAQAAAMQLRQDPIVQLERKGDDVVKATANQNLIDGARDRNATFWADDFEANKALRRRARADRADHAERDAQAAKFGLAVPLLPTGDPADAALARAVRFKRSRPTLNDAPALRRRVAATSIFAHSSHKKQKSNKKLRAAKTLECRGMDPAHLRLRDRVTSSSSSPPPSFSSGGQQRR